MPPMKKDGCLDWEGMIADGENPAGIVNVNVNRDQIGVRPRDFLGPQQFSWGGERDGDRFKPYGPFYADGGEEGGEGGPFAAMPASPRRTRKR